MTMTAATANPFQQFLRGLELAASAEFDENGIHEHTGREWNARGFNAQGIHRLTGTTRDRRGFDQFGYDADGFHRSGWNPDGLHRNGTRFDDDGFDVHGFDRDGWMTKDWLDRGRLTADEWLRQDCLGRYPETLLPIHRETGTIYGHDGFNYFGFDRDGYDKKGFSRGGETGTHVWTDRDGYFPNGYDERGYDREGYNARGLDGLGFTRERLHGTTGSVWSPDGIHGLTGTGYGPDGYDRDGLDARGYGRDGYDGRGFNADGNHRETGTPYGPDGRTRTGLDRDGFDRCGRDSLGYEKGERAPSRVYDLAGWNHHQPAERLVHDDADYRGRVPRNLHREGWRHEAGQGWNTEKAAIVLESAFTHKDTGMHLNPAGFNVVGFNRETHLNERGFDIDTKVHSITGTEFDETGWNYDRTECQPV